MLTNVSSEQLLEPIRSWINEDGVSEIVLNEPGVIFVEQSDGFYRHKIPEFDHKRLHQLFRLIANENHQELNDKKPLLSGVLKNGSRIQLIVPPVSSSYAFSIRKKHANRHCFSELKNDGYFNYARHFSLTADGADDLDILDQKLLEFYQKEQWADFIKLALTHRKNIVISGATSSGKTSFLNACLNEVPLSERLVILEDTPEVCVPHPNSIRLLAYKGQQGLSGITMQDLVQCSLRLRPDRIIVGEVRGKELLDYIGASLTGHSGAITTIHAENPRIAFVRMCQMYKLNALPAMTDQDIYNEIKQAVDIIFQLKRNMSERYLESVYFKNS